MPFWSFQLFSFSILPQQSQGNIDQKLRFNLIVWRNLKSHKRVRKAKNLKRTIMSNQEQKQQSVVKPSRAWSRIKAAQGAVPVLSDKPWVSLPKDMYAHTPVYIPIISEKGCQTEWWWHIGTLKSVDGKRTFGFEINACALYNPGAAFTEVMLTDVEKQIHYHESKSTIGVPLGWAETDQSKPWRVTLENVAMNGPQGDPTQDMTVQATLNQGPTKVEFDLTMTQDGAPLYVFGDGAALHPGQAEPNLSENNYYFSLTRISTSGTIKIYSGEVLEPEIIEVAGETWMDHEWGNFTDKSSSGKTQSVQWILQDMQLENGITLSNFTLSPPTLDVPMKSMATVQLKPGGESHYVETSMTVVKEVPFTVATPTKTDPNKTQNRKYYTEIVVSVPEFGIEAFVKSSMPKQLFAGGIYEGVGTVTAVVNAVDGSAAPAKEVKGTAWVEQNIF
jgi:predicted secreted hydrolase